MTVGPGVQADAGAPIGLSIASHSGLPPGRIGELAAAAERAGFGAVFVAEGHGDALALCHPVAGATSRARVGTAVTNAALRPPVLAAKTAAQLDHAAGGRLVLGLGVGNPIMNGRFGIAPFPPLQMIEEYVAVVRAVLAGSPAGYSGTLFRTGVVPLDSPPARRDLPIYLGALGPRMLDLAGRIADGVVLNLMSPAQAGEAAGRVRAAAAAAGRDPAGVEIVCVVHCCLSSDAVAAAAAARDVVPRYVLHPAVAPLFGEDGRGTDLRPVRELLLGGDRAGATARVPQAVADGFVAHGDANTCGRRLAEYRAAGVDLPVLFPMPVGGDWAYEETIASFAPGGPGGPAGAGAAGAGAAGAGPAGASEASEPAGPAAPGKEAVPSARNL
ncbi:MAG TPA: LLM class flavin-dependent oxidoreductase [Streptosporangiaceae bacterium]|nr:LLM class flavin-dependent oxidoreductase [Streptosporangiaceae bacterium]